MTTTAERQRLIEMFRQLPGQVERLVAGLSAEQLTSRPLEGEWSVAQNVHHLFDSHANSYVRCKLMLTEANPPLKPYDQDAWAALPDGQSAEIAVSLALLANLHTRWVQFWQGLPDDAWGRTGTHPEAGVITLDDQLRTYAAHGEAHLDQITRTIAALGR